MAETTRRDDARGRGDADVPGDTAREAHTGPADPDATAVLPVTDGPDRASARPDGAAGDPAGAAAAGTGSPWGPTGAGRDGGDPRRVDDEGRDALAPDAPDTSPLAVFDTDERRRRWPRVLATAVGVLIVLAGAYVGASWALADVVPRGTTVAGVDVGGMGRDEAVAALESELAPRADEEVPVSANGRTTAVDPAAAGLTLDTAATVDRLTGFDLQPGRLWKHLVGNADQAPATDVDDAALSAAVEGVAGTLATDPVDGGIVFADGAPHVTPATDGSLVDEDAAADVLRAD
jgi:hypothetical protein